MHGQVNQDLYFLTVTEQSVSERFVLRVYKQIRMFINYMYCKCGIILRTVMQDFS